jgi:hypothetical protein
VELSVYTPFTDEFQPIACKESKMQGVFTKGLLEASLLIPKQVS